MKFSNLYIIAFTAATILFSATSCKKEDPVIPHEEELITTMTWTLTPNGGGSDVVFEFKDLDGDGGADPVITNGTLSANTTYSGTLTFLNETEDPADNITLEIETEGTDHQIFYEKSGANITVNYDDQDSNGNPIGLTTSVSTADVSSGTITITLRHQPDKTAENVSSGDISNAGGETDISVTFDVEIQ